jgi:hypothetical protein
MLALLGTGGWVPDEDREEVLPIGTTFDDAVKRFVEILQSSLSGDWNPKRPEVSKRTPQPKEN